MRNFAIAALIALGFGVAPAVADPVAVLVAIPVPKAMPRAQLEALFRQSIPEYAKLPGLVRKYYTLGDDGRAGGIYLWSSRAAAEAWYDDAWKAGVAKRWGAPADVRYFDVPAVVEGQNPGGAQ